MGTLRRKSLVIGCVDDRVQDPLNDLCRRIEEEDGVGPYRHTRFGAALDFALDMTREAALYGMRAALPAITRIVLIEHDGGDHEPGCLAYQIEYSDANTPLQPDQEDLLHRANLVTAERVLHEALDAIGRAGEVQIVAYIDHHDTGLEEVELPVQSTVSSVRRST